MKYQVERSGAITNEQGAILYEADSIRALSRAAKKRLAELHAADPHLEWEGSIKDGRKGAWDILIEEGLAPPPQSA